MPQDMPTVLRWYATSVFNPDHLLAGPYETLDEAKKQCLLLTSELNKQRAANALSVDVTAYYTPRLVRTDVRVPMPMQSIHATEAYSTCVIEPSFVKPVPVPQPRNRGTSGLLAKLERMQHHEILAVAAYLEITVNEHANRLELIAKIRAGLAG